MVLIDGNSILNRAFYGIMGNKMLMTSDGTYTNAVYGFLAIMFKILEDINPEYLVVTFDLKAPTHRHKLYDQYKANRKGMPDELAMQMPLIKEVLKAMNICIIEKEGYEADDVIGTLAKYGQNEGLDVTILTGDRDSFQLIDEKIRVRIPRTKMGKTETEDYTVQKILEEYGLEPKKLIEVKGLMGDTSDNIPGVPGVGEKTAINLIKEYNNIEELYEKLENGTDTVKGKLREKLVDNKELALLSKVLGTIDINVPLDIDLNNIEVKPWNNAEVLEIFKKLRFNRYIERFSLRENAEQNTNTTNTLEDITLIDYSDEKEKCLEVLNKIKNQNKMFYIITTRNLDLNEQEESDNPIIIPKEIDSIYMSFGTVVIKISNKNNIINCLKDILEDNKIKKIGFNQKEEYILFKQLGIDFNGVEFDTKIAAYILNPTNSKYVLEDLFKEYLDIDIKDYFGDKTENSQINLFDSLDIPNTKSEDNRKEIMMKANCIEKLYNALKKKLEETHQLELFTNIEMPTLKVLAKMQYAGMYVDKDELLEYGNELKEGIEKLTNEIHELCGEEFNINSTKQLGEILFEKLKLPVKKKTKNGYSTDVDVLEKLRFEHPVIEKILEYRQLMKLNSTYVEGMLPYINKRTNRIHSAFHQTVTATGRISSTEPNLQNIPTRIELGKRLRKVFKVKEGYVFVDADYSQIELRVLAHISEDEHMIHAFLNNEDIHAQAASKVFNIPLEEVSKEKRSEAKAVNFGIVYGISDFGLAEQLGISRKTAKQYIEQYLKKYIGIKNFMSEITEKAKELGYVETLFKRRRYIPELKSNNYMVRQFGNRVAMNTPIQGTAADIMKIAMINADRELESRNLKSRIVLQIHDELLLEVAEEEKDEVKKLLKESMENACSLKVPLIVEMCEAKNWYEAK